MIGFIRGFCWGFINGYKKARHQEYDKGIDELMK